MPPLKEELAKIHKDDSEWFPVSDKHDHWTPQHIKGRKDKWRGGKAPIARMDLLVREVEQPLSETFLQEAEKWDKETRHLSITAQKVLHPSYQAIMAMGPDVVPLLLADLQKTKRSWFWALKHLTQADPVQQSDKGHVDKMIEAWIAWGKREGKIS